MSEICLKIVKIARNDISGMSWGIYRTGQDYTLTFCQFSVSEKMISWKIYCVFINSLIVL